MYKCSNCGKLCSSYETEVSYEDCTPYGGYPEPGFTQRYEDSICPHCGSRNSLDEEDIESLIDSLMDTLQEYLEVNHPELFDEDGDLDVALCNDNCEDFPSCFNEQVNTQEGLSIELDFDYYKQGENKIYLTYSYEVED